MSFKVAEFNEEIYENKIFKLLNNPDINTLSNY